MPLFVGTSGWQYPHWRGALYPPGVPQRLWLEHYASQYATVENDGTFYRLPAPETFAGWRDRTPDDFVMALKASRYLTHVKRLLNPAEPVARLMRAATELGTRLGPVLLQLPPTLTADPPRLAACLAAFATVSPASRVFPRNSTALIAVEPRHPSWWTEATRDVLTAHGACLCWADQLGHPVTPLWRTADWGYIRFHQADPGGRPPGTPGISGAASPWPRYGTRALLAWLDRLTMTWPDEAPVYVFFNNDADGGAVADSAEFAALARRAGRTVSRTPSAP
jgi:uncharacterized protein YecE (DUF72 family)